MLTAFINHHHRRVMEFIYQQRRERAYRNPGRTDKNQRRIAMKRLPDARREAAVKRQESRLYQRFTGITGHRQRGAQPFRQRHTAGGQAKERNALRLCGIHG